MRRFLLKKLYVYCNLCREDNTQLLLTKDSFNIVKCKNCGLVYVNPMPVDIDYDESYFLSPNAEKWGCNNYIREKNVRLIDLKNRLNRLNIIQSGARLLEIGCASGLFLELAAQRGFEGVGVEVSKFASAYARGKGLNVLTGRLRDQNFPTESFDVVVMWHVIEHLVDPAGELLEINRILRRGGYLFIECPNVASLNCRFVSTVTRKFNAAFKLPEHIHYFSPDTLDRILRKTSFEVIHMETNNVRGGLETLRLFFTRKFVTTPQHKAIPGSKQNPFLKIVRALARNVARASNLGDNIEVIAKKPRLFPEKG